MKSGIPHHLRVGCVAWALAMPAAGCGDSGGSSGTGRPVEPGQAARAAVLIASCFPQQGPNELLRAFYSQRGDVVADKMRDKLPCLAKTGGCAAVKECLGAEFDRMGPCPAKCDGQVLQECADPFRFRLDCSKLGLNCVMVGTRPECLAGTKAPPACDPLTFKSTCTSAPVICVDRIERRGPVCADLGLACGDNPLDFAEKLCRGAGATCSPQSTNPLAVEYQGLSCVENKLESCVNGGIHVLDCKTIGTGLACQTTGGSPPASFCGLAAECDPALSKGIETCDANSVVVCNAGRIEKVSCTDLGFMACDPSLRACVPPP